MKWVGQWICTRYDNNRVQRSLPKGVTRCRQNVDLYSLVFLINSISKVSLIHSFIHLFKNLSSNTNLEIIIGREVWEDCNNIIVCKVCCDQAIDGSHFRLPWWTIYHDKFILFITFRCHSLSPTCIVCAKLSTASRKIMLRLKTRKITLTFLYDLWSL